VSTSLNTADFQEVFRSLSRTACEERALVLTAVNIQGSICVDGTEWILGVEPSDALRALAHLHQYKMENVPAPPPPPAPRLHEHAWVGAVAYSLVLLGVALAISNGLWRPDAFEIGALDAARLQSGQWWRLWTALTLHVSAQHLFANLGGGVWFGILAARQLGAGTAWLLIVTGAALAKVFIAYVRAPCTVRKSAVPLSSTVTVADVGAAGLVVNDQSASLPMPTNGTPPSAVPVNTPLAMAT